MGRWGLISGYAGSIDDDPTCTGTTTYAREANDLFEAGILLVQAAGNGGHESTTDCKVIAPGAAIGSFTVAGHTNNYTTEGESEVRGGIIWSESATVGSARGGTTAEGDERTIIDISAAACRKLLPDTGTGYTGEDCGTSWSAPTVTGAAIDLIDFYRNEISSLIYDPGVLTANLLLMADGQGADGYNPFSNLWGAGRLRMRMYNSTGMDTPWGRNSFITCVDNSLNVYYPSVNGVQLSSDVDVLKAAIWWYDKRHENGTSIDNIDLYLERYYSGGGYWGIVDSSAFDFDEKERIWYENITDAKYRLRVRGTSVTSDSAGCGTDSMKVYGAYFYEDSDRDDADGPAGSTVYPE